MLVSSVSKVCECAVWIRMCVCKVELILVLVMMMDCLCVADGIDPAIE